MQKPKPKFLLKDQLFNKEKVEYLSGLIKNIYPDFLDIDFKKEILNKFPELELKQRISHISDMLKKYLPDNFEKAVNIMIDSLPKIVENGTFDNNFGDFIFVPYCDYIQKFGCNKKYLEFSLTAQGKITAHASAEDSIRYFLNKFEKETFKKILEWSKSKNYYHRRLASEGTRPKLPWCQKINLDYKKTIKILDNLYADNSRFVTRSIANHLNDISKIEGDLVIKILEKWKTHPQPLPCKEGSKNDLDYIISHSTRTLVKAGDKKTLEFLGYSSNPNIEVQNFEIKNDKINIGETLEFDFNILFNNNENLIIDYKIHFLLKNGKLGTKVFKIKKLLTEGFNPLKHTLINSLQKISKKHPLKIMSTKTLYSGTHYLEIQINGKSFGKKKFKLI